MDVTDCEPYAKVACPHCDVSIRVRRQFKQFLIEEHIGSGGLSRVFRAMDQTLGRHVALKILQGKFLADEERIAEFEREARVMASVTHPHIAKLFAAGRDQGHFYIAMELVERGSFEQLIHKQGRLPESLVIQWAEQIARGLEAAWERGVIHRDIKPGNILLAEDQSAKIVDFGLALIRGLDREHEDVWATPHYVAPEKLTGQLEDFRGDIYSLGATLYHCLTGGPPHDVRTNSMEELRRVKSRPVDLGDAPQQFGQSTRRVVNRMLALDPEERHPSYEELLSELAQASESFKPIPSQIPSSSLTLERDRRRNQRRVGWAAALFLVSAVVAGGVAWKREQSIRQVGSTWLSFPTEESLSPNLSEPFLEGRKMLSAGHYGKALELFESVFRNEAAPQPTKSWAIFLAGLSRLFQGDELKAREQFAELLKQDGFTEQSESWREFFLSAGTRLAGPEPIPVPLASNFPWEDSARSVPLLAYGLKNWAQKRFDDAAPFFARFRSLSTPDSTAWLVPLKMRAGDYWNDLKAWEGVPAAEDLADVEGFRDAIEKAKQVRSSLRTAQPFLSVVEQGLNQLVEKQKLLADQEQRSLEAESRKLEAKELQGIAQTWSKIVPLGTAMRFEDGFSQLQSLEVSSKVAQRAKADCLWFWNSAKELIGTSATQTEVVAKAKQALEQTSDSRVYYRELEKLAAFALVTGQRTLFDQVSDGLVLENRAFRELWNRLQSLQQSGTEATHE